MHFVLYLFRHNKVLIILAGLIGALSGAANAGLLGLVNRRLTTFQEGQPDSFTFFLLVGLAAFLTGIISSLLLIYLSQKLTYRLRVKMGYQIMQLPLRTFEETGSGKLVATFAGDILTIAGTLLSFPSFFVNITITLGCLTYLGFLSPTVLGIFVAFIFLSVASYLLPERIAVRYLKMNREAWDTLFKEFNAINQGIKELKLHYRRRQDFFNKIFRESADRVRRTGNVHRVVYTIINQWGSLLYFVFMGILLFIVPTIQTLDLKTLTGYVLISLYLAAPVSSLINVVPTIRAANIAFNKIKSLGLDMLGHYEFVPFEDSSAFLEKVERQPNLKKIELRGITHTYYREKEDSHFTLGPIDMEANAGELIFIIGGNGSGKTTLAKLLTGLYTPEAGEIWVNGQPLGEGDWEAYRQYFSAIFDNFFIFEQALGLEQENLDEKALAYLKEFHLDHKITIEGGRLSTTDLSAGQRKRLALVMAYLEDRPVYVFDEWAAEQDPEFKTVFYHKILPDLKARGKTVFVISHDDRYFSVADRIVKLADGQVESQHLRLQEGTQTATS